MMSQKLLSRPTKFFSVIHCTDLALSAVYAGFVLSRPHTSGVLGKRLSLTWLTSRVPGYTGPFLSIVGKFDQVQEAGQ